MKTGLSLFHYFWIYCAGRGSGQTCRGYFTILPLFNSIILTILLSFFVAVGVAHGIENSDENAETLSEKVEASDEKVSRQPAAVGEINPLSLDECSSSDLCDELAHDDRREQASMLDYSHGYMTDQFDSLARWIDGFFGTHRADAEAANSFVRLRYEMLWEESGEMGNKVRLRGKVSLPLLNERLKLVFFDDEEELLPGQGIDDTEIERDNSGGVGLQYSITERPKFRLDYRIGVRSGNELRTGVRMRYALPLSERNLARFSEEVYWQDQRGFGTKTVIDLERSLNARQLLRWSNRFDFTEDTVGLPWRSVLSFNHIFKENHAVAYYIRAAGETRPDYITTDYGPGFLYRINLWKKWFFIEFEPNYLWKRLPESYKHEGVAGATIRFEILFSDRHRQLVLRPTDRE